MKNETPSEVPKESRAPGTLAGFRAAAFQFKERSRKRAARASVAEKLLVLEEMRDFTSALRGVRDENKARLRSAWERAGAASPPRR